MIFLRPMWLLGLIPLTLLLCWLYYRVKNYHNWQQVCDSHLLHQVQVKESVQSTPFWLFSLTLAFSILALSGPSFTKIAIPVFKNDTNTIIALDLSPDMSVQDVQPNRFKRAIFKTSDLLKNNPQHNFGLIAFTAQPFTVSPVSYDVDTIRALLNNLSPDLLPVAGRNLALAITHAGELLKQSGQVRGNILLVTTASANTDAIKQAKKLLTAGIRTSVLGIGTSTGGPVASNNGFAKDANGKLSISRLDVKSLQELASAGGGTYQELTADNKDIQNIVNKWKNYKFQEQPLLKTLEYRDDGYWLLWLIIPIASLAFRRTWRELIL